MLTSSCEAWLDVHMNEIEITEEDRIFANCTHEDTGQEEVRGVEVTVCYICKAMI